MYGRRQEDCVPSDNQIEAQAMAPTSHCPHLHSHADLEQTQTMGSWESVTVWVSDLFFISGYMCWRCAGILAVNRYKPSHVQDRLIRQEHVNCWELPLPIWQPMPFLHDDKCWKHRNRLNMELRPGTGVFYSRRQGYGYRRLVGDSCPHAHVHPEATVQLGNPVQ